MDDQVWLLSTQTFVQVGMSNQIVTSYLPIESFSCADIVPVMFTSNSRAAVQQQLEPFLLVLTSTLVLHLIVPFIIFHYMLLEMKL